MASFAEKAAEARADEIQKLENEMMEWVRGEKSHWNYYNNLYKNPGDASAMCSIADTAEVQKLSAAIQALRS